MYGVLPFREWATVFLPFSPVSARWSPGLWLDLHWFPSSAILSYALLLLLRGLWQTPFWFRPFTIACGTCWKHRKCLNKWIYKVKSRSEIDIAPISCLLFYCFFPSFYLPNRQTGRVSLILSILVDTFSSRLLNPMLLPSGKRNIVVFWSLGEDLY